MYKNYFTIAWRNIMRHKLFAAINVVGLALGIAACLAIYLITDFEFSFDTFHPGKEKIFRIVSDNYSTEFGEEHHGNIPDPAPFAIRREITGLASVAVFHNYRATVTIQGNNLPEKRFIRPSDRSEERSDIVIAEPSYFDIFQYEWLAGNQAAFNEPYTVVLTESKARKYFGGLAPAGLLNKTIIYNDSLYVKVAGIVKDFGKNTDFFFRDFISFSTVPNSFLKNEFTLDSWRDGHMAEQVFIKLNKDVQPSHINAQLINFVNRHLTQTKGHKVTYRLQPLSTIHFDAGYSDAYSRKVHLPTLYGIMVIALFILIIAVINFITLSTAQSIDRAKEAGIRKICGSTATDFIIRYMGETLVLTLLAVILAVACIQPILTVFQGIIPDGLHFSVFNYSTWLFLVILTVITAVLAGFYPAKVLSAAAPAFILKGAAMQKGNRKGLFTKGLILFQFTISLVFIIGTLVVGKQMQYMQDKDLGFTKDAICTIETHEDYPAAKKELLAEKIRQLPEVNLVSVSEGTPVSKLHWFNPLTYKGKEEKGTATILEWGDQHFIPLYNIKIIAGRNVHASDTVKEFLINESCAKALGFTKPEEAVGKMVETFVPGGNMTAPPGIVARPIVGVMADFHSQSLHDPVKPVLFATSTEFTRLINIQLNTSGKQLSHVKATMAKIEDLWHEVYPNDPYSYTFFDEAIASLYTKERHMAQLMNLAMIIAIGISCLGLFGLATLTARQRTKEIGIRKVLGADIAQIVLILNKDTFKLVLIAVVIASPLAWYFMHQWLNGFTYRIAISWWMFVLAGVMALLIAFCTVSYQSIKAALANPVNSLRSE
ncbi:MAG TPA: ABC transporter permease [Niastella sp.]